MRGFLPSGEVRSVTETMHLTSGEPWSIPIIFPVDEEQATSLSKAERLVLEDEMGVPAAVLHIEEIFKIDKSSYARHIFRTEDAAHPGVDWLLKSGDFSLAGPVQTFEDWEFNLPGDFRFHLARSEPRRSSGAGRKWWDFKPETRSIARTNSSPRSRWKQPMAW